MAAAKTAAKTSRKRATKARPTVELVTLASVHAAKARKLDSDVTAAAKINRSFMRRNFAKVCELSPNVLQAKDAPNDRKPWPKAITRDAAAYILGGNVE